MQEVHDKGSSYVVTKHNKPVAMLVPYPSNEPKAYFGSMRGTVIPADDLIAPTGEVWNADLG